VKASLLYCLSDMQTKRSFILLVQPHVALVFGDILLLLVLVYFVISV